MIYDVTVNSDKIEELERLFPNVFIGKPIKNDFYNNPFTRYYAYLIDGNIVGFINYTLIYDRMEIININVLPKFRRKGVATKLMEIMIDNGVVHKVSNITLEVRKDNEAAISLYRKYGFSDVAIRKKYYGNVDGILMEKEMM